MTEILEPVKKYQQNIELEQKLPLFSWKAFLFGPLYFLYLDIYLYSFLFLILWVGLIFLIIILTQSPITFIIAPLVSHLIAGFAAPRILRWYQCKFIEKYQKENPA